jgi:HK97 family phage prohead protease
VGGRARALVSRGALAYRAQPALLQRAMVSLESEIKGNIFEGYAAVFGQVSDKTGEDWREQFAEGSFDDVIAEQLTAALWNHNPDHLLGRQSSGTLRLSADSGGLHVRTRHSRTPPSAETCASCTSAAIITGASVGFLPGLDTWGLTEQGDAAAHAHGGVVPARHLAGQLRGVRRHFGRHALGRHTCQPPVCEPPGHRNPGTCPGA